MYDCDLSLQNTDMLFSKREARVLFKAGVNRDGWFGHEHLMDQVREAIDIFEERFGKDVKALFMFDNATIHQKCAPDALSAMKMPKLQGWQSKSAPVRMRNGVLPGLNMEQEFYLPNPDPTSNKPGPFKGMAQILVERGFHNAFSLPAQCKGFKCKDVSLDAWCCCRCILYNQPDFRAQKPQLVEYIENRGHLAFYYPKFHCELNFIEQYWGAAKQRYRVLPWTSSISQMESNVRMCLDEVLS